MPKIRNPDGKRAPTYTREQHNKLRMERQGRKQDGTFTDATKNVLRRASEVMPRPDDLENWRVTCPSCGLCFPATTNMVLEDELGRRHHTSHRLAL